MKVGLIEILSEYFIKLIQLIKQFIHSHRSGSYDLTIVLESVDCYCIVSRPYKNKGIYPWTEEGP